MIVQPHTERKTTKNTVRECSFEGPLRLQKFREFGQLISYQVRKEMDA